MVLSSCREQRLGSNCGHYHRRHYCSHSHSFRFSAHEDGPFVMHCPPFSPQMQQMRDGVRLRVDSRGIAHFPPPPQLSVSHVSRLQEVVTVQYLEYQGRPRNTSLRHQGRPQLSQLLGLSPQKSELFKAWLGYFRFAANNWPFCWFRLATPKGLDTAPQLGRR